MTLRDLAVIAAGNLWRMKLRTTLTMAGVLIAITAFVAMLSFGAGNQAYIEGEFNKLGLFTTMQVYPIEKALDSIKHPPLDDAALERLAAIPGVNLVYPYDAMSVTATVGDSVVRTKAQALPTAAVRTKLHSRLAAGRTFSSDSAKEALVTPDFLEHAGLPGGDSALGTRITVSVKVSTVDSALSHVVSDRGVTLWDRIKTIEFDSLFRGSYRNRVLRREGGELARRFVRGFTDAQATVTDTLTICGIREEGRRGRLRTEEIILPVAVAARFKESGIGGGPVEIFSAMSSGTLFGEGRSSGSYTQVTIDYDPKVMFTGIRDSVKALGYRSFSFAEQFEEIQRSFIYFDLALGVVGLIALVTASLGIANTMIMSINERRREIGVLKSLGADESNIRALFLVESGVIGLIGTAGGILTGWGITRIVSAIVKSYMRSEGVPVFDLFALPYWLILIALALGVSVSVLAGYYPAARAARIDPVAALRND